MKFQTINPTTEEPIKEYEIQPKEEVFQVAKEIKGKFSEWKSLKISERAKYIRKIADVLRKIQEKNPYIRGLVSWVGFKQTGFLIQRQERFAGQTKYTLRKMLKLAWNGVTHFSFLPLQLSTFVGFVAALIAFVWMIHALYVSLVLHSATPGWTSLIIAVLFLGSVQLITIGIVGSYLARNYDESRSRPLYVLSDKKGFDA